MQPDKEQAAAFLRFLDPPATRFTFQSFDDNADRKAPWLARVLHGSLDECWGRLVALSQAGAGIFVCINETNGAGRKSSDIVRVRCLFADLDGAPLSNLWRVPLELGWINRTRSGRYHGLWKADGVALDEFTPLQKAIISRTGGDRAIHDLPRVLRLPGFSNLKKAPFMVDGVAVNAEAINSPDACMAILPPPVAPSPVERPTVRLCNGVGVNRRYALAALEKEACYVEVARHGERNATLNRAAFATGTLVERGGISAAEIENVLTGAALNAGLHANEIATTIKSELSAGMANPRRIGITK